MPTLSWLSCGMVGNVRGGLKPGEGETESGGVGRLLREDV